MKVFEFLEFLQINEVDLDSDIFVCGDEDKKEEIIESSAFGYNFEDKILTIQYYQDAKVFGPLKD